ncbi:hypothetical protein BXU11_08045 [Flavobacterium sp. LM5]|uniref:hypothetical protein n=1 Tax=Flavobacterium sp. LM5 TaxID=1938610 RepID=UPI00099473F4|nr:hypothetical protein [Flavobacterium sp. LM5]OOV29806.1 hypothetical protein BXU11_08045 [Flavobacterium sp. LM5]
MHIIKIFIQILIVGLFMYSTLLPYKDKLNPQYRSIFDFFNSVFSPIFNSLKTIIQPFQVGVGLAVDMTQVLLLIIFLMLLNFL